MKGATGNLEKVCCRAVNNSINSLNVPLLHVNKNAVYLTLSVLSETGSEVDHNCAIGRCDGLALNVSGWSVSGARHWARNPGGELCCWVLLGTKSRVWVMSSTLRQALLYPQTLVDTAANVALGIL